MAAGVADLVQGITLAGVTPGLKSGEVFYVSGDREYSWEEAMRLIARGMGRKPWTLRLPIPVMKCAGGVCTLISHATRKALPFSLDKVKEIEALAWTCGHQKAKNLLGFRPYWGLAEGLAQTAEWYRQHRWL